MAIWLPCAGETPGTATTLDPDLATRILALDPEHVTPQQVRDVLSAAPAPRIILLQGSVALVTMQPFADYLVAMGYPAARLRNPRDGTMSESSFGSSETLAGTIAWYYENERVMPLVIGHSQGGMLAIRTLHELAGAFNERITVVDPNTGEAQPRTTIVDPLTRAERPVVGLTLPYVTALATGKLPRLLLGQWAMLALLRKIPDTATEFTGFGFEFDPIAGEFGGPEPYVATGSARVRNVTLPAAYTHIGLPDAGHLARHPETRAWIDSYVPGTALPPPIPGVDTTNLLHAADIWYSVRKAWVKAAQQQARVQLARGAS